MSYSPSEAAQVLAAVQASRERVVATATCPPLRHAAFAALFAGLTACPAAGEYMLLAEVPVLLGVALILVWDRRRTGMFVNGYRAGKTRKVTFTLLALELSLYGLSAYLAMGQGLRWAPFALAVPAFALAYAGSKVWARVWKREIEAQA